MQLGHSAYLLRVVIAINIITVGMTSWTLYIYSMALQDCCFFEKSKWIPILSDALE